VIFRRLLYQRARRVVAGYPLHVGLAIAWIVLIETEVDDLISVIEGVDNGWEAQRIRSALINPDLQP